MLFLFILFILILPQLTYELKICQKEEDKCPIYLEKETNCVCKEVSKQSNTMKYFHRHEKENWLKITCDGINSTQMLRNGNYNET